MRRWQNAIFVLGILWCLAGAILMFEGSILGERTTGIAIVIGIVGICLVAGSASTWGLRKSKES